jgi:P4 family phage/plasmid primase-like protien
MGIAKYLNWLVGSKPNQLVNVGFNGQGRFKGKTIPMTAEAIDNLVSNIAEHGEHFDKIWATVHEIKPTTGNWSKLEKADMVAYRYLAIDIDNNVARNRHVCSTDSEREKTLAKATAITTTLMQYGLPQPLKVMSGNGSLLLFPIDLPYTEANYSLMGKVGDTLANAFNDSDCDIDAAITSNPATFLGLVGTINRGKPEDASEGRTANMRVVVGDYPPNEPMDADAFITAVNAFMADYGQASGGILDSDNEGAGVENTVYSKPACEPIEATVWDNLAASNKIKRCRDYIEKCPEAISGNNGHSKAFRAACECYRFGLSDSEAQTVMDWFNTTKCQPMWSAEEIRHKLTDASDEVSRKGQFGERLNGASDTNGEPSESENAPTNKRAKKEYAFTELGNAEHFTDLNRDNVRYVKAWEAWLVWDGTRWVRDTTDKVRRLAQKHVSQAMPKYASTIKSDTSQYLKWVLRSQSHSSIQGMLAEAKTLLAISPDILDANHNLFNVSNGTIELDTQTFRPHSRADMLTKITPVVFDPSATAPTWDKFINRIFQDANGRERLEMILYVQQACGYSLTADVILKCFFVLWGPTNCGKSKFIEAIQTVMGEYAALGSQSVMLKTSSHTHNSDDVADLFGRRLVVVSEPESRQPIDEAKIKRLTGSEKDLKAMRKNEHSFEFKPTHKFWMDTNFEPRYQGDDDAVTDRIKLIPFLNPILERERDYKLGEKLRAEASGILNWMLAGLRSLMANNMRFNQPKEITEAVKACSSKNDPFGLFLADCIQPADCDKVETSVVFAAYVIWAKQNGMAYPISKPEFTKRMGQRKYPNKSSNGKRYYIGCRLKDQSDFESEESDEGVYTNERAADGSYKI